MSHKIAILISGCGVFDGAEIHESVLSMYAVVKHGCSYQMFAPDKKQHHVVNHLTGEEMNEERNVLTEAARIARGEIKDISEYKPEDFEALLLPGGYGVAKNFSSYAFKGSDFSIDTDIEKLIVQTLEAGKPIGALCISPMILARLVANVKVTIGDAEGDIENIKKIGADVQSSEYDQAIVDHKNKIVTAACYQKKSNIYQVGEGAEAVVTELIKLIG